MMNDNPKRKYKHSGQEKIIPSINLRNAMWKDINCFEGLYQINENGIVKSVRRLIQFTNRWGNTCARDTGEKILPWYISSRGYARVVLSKNSKHKHYTVHRLVVNTFVGNPNNLPHINHEDGDKMNNNYKNLKPCTTSYNQRHAYDTGLNIPKKGKEHPQSKSVKMFNIKSNTVKIFGSMGEAHGITGISRAEIRRSCIGEKIILKKHSVKFEFI